MLRSIAVYTVYLSVLAGGLTGIHYTIDYITNSIDSILIPCQHGTEYRSDLGRCDCTGTPFTGKFCEECACENGGICNTIDVTTPFLTSTFGCKCPTLFFGTHCQNCFANDTDTCTGVCQDGYTGFRCHRRCDPDMTIDDLFSSALDEEQIKCKQLYETIGATCNVCSGHGSCNDNAECECDSEWYDTQDGRGKCARSCGDCGHGTCQLVDGVLGCRCEAGWSGDGCDIPCPGALDNNVCGGHGSCVGTTCDCTDNYYGLNCNLTCPEPNCNGNGDCIVENDQAVCNCRPAFKGPACNCTLTSCHYHGDCDDAGVCQCRGNFDPSTNCETCLPNYWGESCSHFCDAQTCNGRGTCLLVDVGLRSERIECGCDDGFDPSTKCLDCYETFFPKYATVGDIVTQAMQTDGIQRACEIEITDQTCTHRGKGNPLYGTMPNMCTCDTVHLDASTNCAQCEPNYFPQPGLDARHCTNWCSSDASALPSTCSTPVDYYNDQRVDMFDLRCLHASGNGICDERGTPICDPGYSGEFCNRRCANNCNGHGTCGQDKLQELLEFTIEVPGSDINLYTCECDEGYYGEDCEYSCPRPPFADPQECNGIGECEQIEIEPGYTCYDDNDCGNFDSDGVLQFTGSVLNQNQQAQLRSTLSLGFTKEMGPYCHKNKLPQSLNTENFKCVNLTDMAFNCSALDAATCETHSGCGYRDQCTFDSKAYCYDYLSAQKPDMMYHDECTHIDYDWVQTCTDYSAMVDYYETTYPECTVNYMSLYMSNDAHWDTVVSLTTDPYDDVTYCWQRKDMNDPFSTHEQLWSGYGDRTRFQGTSMDVTDLCTNLSSSPTYSVTQPQPVYDCEGELREAPNQFVCSEVTAESLGEDFKPYVLRCMDGDRSFQNWTEAWSNMRYGCDIVVDPLLGRLVVPEDRFEKVRAVCDAVPTTNACGVCPASTTCTETPLGVDCNGDITTVPDACSITGVTTLSCNVTAPDPEPWYDICTQSGPARRVRVWIHLADARPYTLIFGNDSAIVYFVNGGVFLNQVTELESCPIGEGECHDTYAFGWQLVTLEIGQGQLTFMMGDTVLNGTISNDIAHYQFNGDSKHFEMDVDTRCEFLHRLRYPYPWTGDILNECTFISKQTLPGSHDWEAYCAERAQYVDRSCTELDFTLDEIKTATPLLTIFDKGVCLKRYLEDTAKPATVRMQDQGTCRMSQISVPSFCARRSKIYGENGLLIPENTCDFDAAFQTEDWDDWCLRVTKHTQPGVCAGVMCNCHSEVNLGISGDSCQLYCDVHADGSPCGEKSDAGVCSYTQKQAEALRSGFIFEKGSTNMRGECKCFLDTANRVCEVNCDPDLCPPQHYNVSYFNFTVEMKTATCDRTTGGCNCLPPYIGEFEVNQTTWTGHTVHVSTFQGFPYTLKREGEACTTDQECQEGACGVLCGKKVRSCEEMGLPYDWSNASQNNGASCTYDRDTCTGDDIAYYPTNARFYDAHTLCADLCDDNPRCQCFTIRTQDNVCILKDGQETRRRLSTVSGSLQGDMYVYDNVDASCATTQTLGNLDMCKRLCIGDCKGFFFDGSHCDIASERCALFTGARTFYAKMETGYMYNFQSPIVKMRERPGTQDVEGVNRLACAHIAYNRNCTTFQSLSTFDMGLLATFNATDGFHIGPGYAKRVDNECQVFHTRKEDTSPMQIGDIAYGDAASWDECLEACRTTLACKQVVYYLGACYGMRAASNQDATMDDGVTYTSAHCNTLESVSGIRLDEPMTVTFNADIHILGAFVGINSHEDLQFTNDTVTLPDGTSFTSPPQYAKWMLDVTPDHLMFGYIDTLSRKHIIYTQVENPVLPGDFTAHIISQQQQSGSIEQVSIFPTNPLDNYRFRDFVVEENYVKSIRVWHHDIAYESEFVEAGIHCVGSILVGSQNTLEECARAAYDAYPHHTFFLFDTGSCLTCPSNATYETHASLHKFSHKRSPRGRASYLQHSIDKCPEGHSILDQDICKTAAKFAIGDNYKGVWIASRSETPPGCGYSGPDVHYNTNYASTSVSYPSSWGSERGSICVYYDMTLEDMSNACCDLRICTDDEVMTHELRTGLKLSQSIHCCRDTIVYHQIPISVPETYKITMDRGSFGTSDVASEEGIEWYDHMVDCQAFGKERPTDVCGKITPMVTRKTALSWGANDPRYMAPPGEPEACEHACSTQQYTDFYEYGTGECAGDEYIPLNGTALFENKGNCRLTPGSVPTVYTLEFAGHCGNYLFDTNIQASGPEECSLHCSTTSGGFILYTGGSCYCTDDLSVCSLDYRNSKVGWGTYSHVLVSSISTADDCAEQCVYGQCETFSFNSVTNDCTIGGKDVVILDRPGFWSSNDVLHDCYVRNNYDEMVAKCADACADEPGFIVSSSGACKCEMQNISTCAWQESTWTRYNYKKDNLKVNKASVNRTVNYEFIREGHCTGAVGMYDENTANPGTTWDEKLSACAEACVDYVGFIIVPQGINEGYCDCSTVETPCTSLHDGTTNTWHRYDYIDKQCQSFEWSETGCYMTRENIEFRQVGDYDAWYAGTERYNRDTWVQLRDDTWQNIESCDIKTDCTDCQLATACVHLNRVDTMLTQDETVTLAGESVSVPGQKRLDSDYEYFITFTDKLTIGYEHPVWEKTELYSEPTSISVLTVKSTPTMFHFRGKRECIGTFQAKDLSLDACMQQCEDHCVAIGFCDHCDDTCLHFSDCMLSTTEHANRTYYMKTQGSDIRVVKDTTKPLPNPCGQRVEPSGAIVQTFDVDQCKCQQLCEEHGCISWMWDGTCHFKDGDELYESTTLYGGLGGTILESCEATCGGDFSIESDTLYDMPHTIVESETDYIIHKNIAHSNLEATYAHSASRLDGTPHPYRVGDMFKGFTVAEISKESVPVPGSIVRDIHWYADDGAASYSDREQDCASRGLGLCTYDQLCPYGRHHMPTESILRGEFWTPIRTEPTGNQWVSVGSSHDLCSKLSEVQNECDWCDSRVDQPWKQHYACCEAPLPTMFVTSTQQCAVHTARAEKTHFELGDMLYVKTVGDYEYTKEEAEDVCEAEGMQLCSKAQHINGVVRKQIRDVCKSGWLTDDEGWYQLDPTPECGDKWSTFTPDSGRLSAHCCARQCTPTDIGPLKPYHKIGDMYCAGGATNTGVYTGSWEDVVKQCAASCTESPAFMVSDARYNFGACYCFSLDFSSCSTYVLDNTWFVDNGYDISNYYRAFAFSNELHTLAPTHMGFGEVYAVYRGRIGAGEKIVSRNGDYTFTVGIGIHHTDGSTVWSEPATSLTIEDNNDLVWCSTECRTNVLGGSAGANSRLELGNDGVLTFYDHMHVPLWRSDTGFQTLDILAAQGYVKTTQFIAGPTPGQCYCTDHGIPYKHKYECSVCADDDAQRLESGTLIFNESHVYAHDNGAFEVIGKKWILTEQFEPFMSYVKNDRFEMTYAACEESAQELGLPFRQTKENAEMRRGCIVVDGTVYWNIIGTEIGSTPGICADLDGCGGSEPCNGTDCHVYRRIGEACSFNRECKTQRCDKTGEFGCKGKCIVVNSEAGGFGNCPSPQNYRKRVAMMQGPDFFMRYVNSSVSQYQAFLRDPSQFMCGAAQCTPYDAVLLQHLSMSGYTYGYDCTSICPGTVGVIPCNGRGRCSKLGKCIADPARVISVTNENTGVRDAMTMGDVTIAAGNVQMSELDRSGVRGDSLDLICPGYDLDARDMRTVCGGHGICSTTAECSCAVGYSGEGCQFTCPGFTGQSNECSGHGVCESVLVTEPSIDNRDTYYSVANSWVQWQEQCEPFETINRIEIAFAGALGDIELVDVHGNVVQPKKITFV